MKHPSVAFELGALHGSGLQRQRSGCATPGIGELSIEQKAQLDLAANRVELGIDRLMEFPQTPDSLCAQRYAPMAGRPEGVPYDRSLQLAP